MFHFNFAKLKLDTFNFLRTKKVAENKWKWSSIKATIELYIYVNHLLSRRIMYIEIFI